MQRCLGYALTGLTTEQVFWILWGQGANGKSTLIELILQHVLGHLDYAWALPFPSAAWSTTMSEYQKASLVGRRFVTASEVSQRGHLNQELIRSLTGDDTLNARHPCGGPFRARSIPGFAPDCRRGCSRRHAALARPLARSLTGGTRRHEPWATRFAPWPAGALAEAAVRVVHFGSLVRGRWSASLAPAMTFLQ